MLVIGLTGGIGSGKSTVAKLFEDLGVTIIDADIITRDLTCKDQPALKEIVKHFGLDILTKDRTLDRAKLRKIIFERVEEKDWLEKLLHPLVRTEMFNQALNATSSYCIAVIPLLLETEKNPLINRILVVDAPEELQLARAKTRDQASHDEITAIIKTQLNRQSRLSHADDVIDNSGTLESLKDQVQELHQKYLSL